MQSNRTQMSKNKNTHCCDKDRSSGQVSGRILAQNEELINKWSFF